MSSSDVLVEHFALRGFIESSQDSLFFTDVGMYHQDGLEDTYRSDHKGRPSLTKGQPQPNQLQSFEHSFGWIRNVTTNDLSYLSHEFLSSLHHEGGPQSTSCLEALGVGQPHPEDIIGWDAYDAYTKGLTEQLKEAAQFNEAMQSMTENFHEMQSKRSVGSNEDAESVARNSIASTPASSPTGSPAGSPATPSSPTDLAFDAFNNHYTSHVQHSYNGSSLQTDEHSDRLGDRHFPLTAKGQNEAGRSLTPLHRNNSEALLALPVFKQESLDSGFQYILSAATSPACKMNEETVTYLNQGQPYELKLKKYGDFSEIKGRTLKSVVRVVFHDRRLQYMEREQLELWRQMRPGERILDIDIPLSYAVQNVKVEPTKLNSIEFTWDPAKDTGIFVKVNSISTEFTAKKHGGEKGVPFRVQVETYIPDDGDYRLAHCSSCQVKVFKPKGADRKHKTDREKMEKRSDSEKEKYQPSYECTVLAEIPLEQAIQYLDNLKQQNLKMDSDVLYCRDYPFQRGGSSRTQHQRAGSDISDNSDNPMTPKQLSGSPPLRNFQYIADSSSNEATLTRGDIPKNSSWSSFSGAGDVSAGTSWVPKVEEKKPEPPKPLPQPPSLAPTATAGQVSTWLKNNRFAGYVSTFSNFSGADLLRLSRDDLIQICGLADGIRLDNALQSKTVRPRLTVYVCQGNPCSSPIQPSLTASGTKKLDSHHGGGNGDGLSNGCGNKPLASGGGAMRQLSPSGPPPTSSKFTLHRMQQPETSPSGGGEPGKSGPSAMSSGVGSSTNNVPLKYKRQLVEDLDSEDQDEEKVVTSSKKQRTRTLELSKKEVFHAIFMEQVTVNDLLEKLAGLFSISVKQIVEIYLVGPNNIDILVTDSVVQNFKDQSRFALDATLVDATNDRYKLHLQAFE